MILPSKPGFIISAFLLHRPEYELWTPTHGKYMFGQAITVKCPGKKLELNVGMTKIVSVLCAEQSEDDIVLETESI